MYKVFVNKSAIILTNKAPVKDGSRSFDLATVELNQIIDILVNEHEGVIELYHPEESELLSLFKEKITVVAAAGGLVKNEKKEVLFIYRMNTWDLPKGKLEKGESIEEAAIREVEEETGVADLSIDKFLMDTYHVFKRKGVYKLKLTHWFLMNTTYIGELEPQLEEDITAVVWKDAVQTEKALENTYDNIKLLFEEV